MNPIKVQNIQKSYGDIQALDDVSLETNENEIFGLIGPDGAGKTTLIRSIVTLLEFDSGDIHVLGYDAKKDVKIMRNIIGYMPQKFSLYPDLTVEQNLNFYADLFQISKSERERKLQGLYAFSKLGQFKKRPASKLSGGMKQKLALSCNLIHQPKILILDEPTFGVDPVSRQEFWEMLRETKKEGISVFVSTAYMDEAEQCDRIGLLHQGKLKAIGAPEEIVKMYKNPLLKIEGDFNQFNQQINQNKLIADTMKFGNSLHVSFKPETDEKELKKFINENSENGLKIYPIEPTIEDVFLQLMD